MLIISWFVCSFGYFFLYSYLFSKILSKDKFKIDLQNVIFATIISVINVILLKYDFGYIRPYIIHIYLFGALIFIYKKSFVKTLLTLLSILLMVCLSEMILGIILIFLFNVNTDEFSKIWFNYVFCNIFEFTMVMVLIRLRFFKKIINNIICWYKENEYKSLVFLVLLALTIVIFLLYNNFIMALPNSILWLTNVFCLAVLIFIIGFFKEKSNNNKIIYEYDQLLDYVKVYEKLLEEKSKNQHEYKNQLIIIRDTNKKDDRVKYINNLLNIKDSTEDSEWLNKLKYIPQGGLKGLIYYKIQIMLKNNVSIFLTVSEELKEPKLWKNFDKNLSNISKIIGVYLDNAIEAVNDAKEKFIIISVYLEKNNIIFEISNTYKGTIDMSRIDKEGYTTKGNGKGYGLSLVKDIISKNDNLEQKRILNGIYYVQQLCIKK